MTETTGAIHVIERRIFATTFRDVKGSNGRQKWATAVSYNRTDDFGTIWLPSCFNQGLDERMPTILYGHDWYTLDHVLGQGIDYKDLRTGCDVLFEFADPELVPPAARAMALTAGPNPILKDVSVGFDRQEWIRKAELTALQLEQGGEEAMVRAVMDELSIVVRGAVPGAQMRGRRSWVIDGTVTTEPPATEPAVGRDKGVMVDVNGSTVSVDVVVELAKRRAAGELTLEEARATLELVGAEDGTFEEVELGSLDEILDTLGGGDEQLLQRAITRLERRMADLFSSDQRQMLRDALTDRFQPGPDRWIWVVDFTDSQVVFEMDGFDDSGTFMLAYTITDNVVTLDAGDPISVNPHTTWMPDTDDTGTAGASEDEHRVVVEDGEAERALARALQRSR